MNKITKIEIFKRVMSKAKSGGYTGPDYEFQLGHIIEDTNIYAVIFREDFAKAIWGDGRSLISSHEFKDRETVYVKSLNDFRHHLVAMSIFSNKWKYLEENALD